MLISLVCSRCQKNLLGENNSRVFFCLDCGLGFDISGSSPKAFGLFFTDARIKKAYPLIYFPFWRITSGYTVMVDNQRVHEPRKRDFFVSAFFIKNIDYFGDIGFYLTANNIQLGSGKRRDFPVFPADRGLDDGVAYPRIFLYREESKKRKGLFDIQIDHEDICIALIPFYRIDSDYYDSIIFWKYPSGALI